jgi:hypothetical protein
VSPAEAQRSPESRLRDHIRLEINQLFREHPQPVNVSAGPTDLHLHVAAVGPTRFSKPLHETGKEGLYLRIAFVPRHEHADPPQQAALLRTRRERQCRCCTAEKRDELAPSHSITSSAAFSRPYGTVRPNVLAALRLITRSNLDDCWTGKSAGFSPLRIRPV